MAEKRRFGFNPGQYNRAQANDVFRQYQRQMARDKAETLKKKSERNFDGKLKINSLELVFLTINGKRWFGISQIVSVLFAHRPRSSVVTRMKMLGIEFYCGNYDELRRMKELGGVETHCSRCKLINEQDLVKLLLCFYRFTALPRGKGKISTNGLSSYLDDILREIALGRVELGKDFHEDDTGKIDEDTWSQISERMLMKRTEKVELITRVPQPSNNPNKDAFAFEVEADSSLVTPTWYTNKAAAEERDQEEEEGGVTGLLPKLIRAERTKKPPRAIWPRWYPPSEEGSPVEMTDPSANSLTTVSAIHRLVSHLKSQSDRHITGRESPLDPMKDELRSESSPPSTPSPPARDMIQVVTRREMENHHNQQNSPRHAERGVVGGEEAKDPGASPLREPEPEYTAEQLEYVKKLKESFDFPYYFPGRGGKHGTGEKREEEEEDAVFWSRFPTIRNPVLHNQIYRRLIAQKRPVIWAGEKTRRKKQEEEEVEEDSKTWERARKRARVGSRERLGSGGSSEEDATCHVYRFKLQSAPQTQDHPYMAARPTSLLRLVKLDKCEYPVGCRSAPFPFESGKVAVREKGPFVREYDLEPPSSATALWTGVSLWATPDEEEAKMTGLQILSSVATDRLTMSSTT